MDKRLLLVLLVLLLTTASQTEASQDHGVRNPTFGFCFYLFDKQIKKNHLQSQLFYRVRKDSLLVEALEFRNLSVNGGQDVDHSGNQSFQNLLGLGNCFTDNLNWSSKYMQTYFRNVMWIQNEIMIFVF